MGLLASKSERHVVVLGLTDEVVAGLEATDEPRLFVDRAVGRCHANGDVDAAAVVGEAGVVALAVLVAPEALPAAPLLEVAREGLVQLGAVAFADVDDDWRSLGVALADDVHA